MAIWDLFLLKPLLGGRDERSRFLKLLFLLCLKKHQRSLTINVALKRAIATLLRRYYHILRRDLIPESKSRLGIINIFNKKIRQESYPECGILEFISNLNSKSMKRVLASIILILSFNVSISPSLSQLAPPCEQQEEIFTFEVPTYAIQHQGGAILSIKVAYRLTPETIAQQNYPDFVPIRKDIDKFLVNYPNETDYWEIVNRKLVQFLLDKYPQMSSLSVEIDVMPTPQEPFRRSSIVKSTRPESCPLTL